MAQVKVWNDNVHPFSQKWRDELLTIKAKEFVLMEDDEAHQFKHSFSPIKRDTDGNPLPTSYKMIRIEKIDSSEPVKAQAVSETKCNACGYLAQSKTDLDEHVTASHLDQMLDEEEVKKRRSKKAG